MRPHPRWLSTALIGLPVIVSAAACVAKISETSAKPNPQTASVGAPSGAQGSQSPDGGTPTCTGTPTPTAGPIRRLTNREYATTVASLLGTTVDVGGLPGSSAPNGYDTNDSSSLSTQHVQGYFAIAKSLAGGVIASAPQRQALFGCDPKGSTLDSCLSSFISSFGSKAYRRPVTPDEVSGLTALAHSATQTDAYAGARMVLEAMLQSPNLIYRPEFGVPDPSRPNLNRLTGLEVATRLSYLLWGTGPDAPLLSLAQSGQLDTGAGVAKTVTSMLTDTRAHDGMKSFYAQWLRLSTGASFAPNTTLFPGWQPSMGSDMAEETARMVDDLVFRSGANFLDLLTGSYSYLNPSLASLYGVPAPTSGTWARVNFGSGDHRGGLLTQGSFLAFTSHPDSISITRRGHYVRDVLLCDPLPPPPPNVNPVLPPAMPGQSDRDRLSVHQTNPSCAGCHSQLDPIGFGLLQFDAIGHFSATDAQGRAYDVTGNINGQANGAFNGPSELEQKLHDSDRVSACIAMQTFRFAMGRAEGSADACTVADVQSSFRSSSYNFAEMLSAFAQSDAFRYIPSSGGM